MGIGKGPTRYRAKAGPEAVLRKASVLFAYKLFTETSQRGQGQSRFEKGVRPFLFIVSTVFSYGASHI